MVHDRMLSKGLLQPPCTEKNSKIGTTKCFEFFLLQCIFSNLNHIRFWVKLSHAKPLRNDLLKLQKENIDQYKFKLIYIPYVKHTAKRKY